MLVKAMSKVYIAGEYAILKKDAYAILAPVKKYTYVEVEKSDRLIVNSSVEDKDDLLKYAREQAFGYVGKTCTLKYTYKTDLYSGGMKLGLGSSASVVVVTIKAILEYFNATYTKDDLFLLSVRALKKAGSNGSMGDVACICFEDLIRYKRIDEDENYEIKAIKPRGNLKINLLHAGISASTTKQVQKVEKYFNTKEYIDFTNLSNKYTLELEEAITTGDSLRVKEDIYKLRNNLKYLEQFTNLTIHSKMLEELIGDKKERKTSGAGLGDFVIEVRLDYDEKRSTYEVCFGM
ncbi:hypothetical protein [uncultured Sneathia sp.]|uniref:mevalonate kinase family protein n=1 Tax=uncultured Sneathia sp. TaxID=278067 RepID=UPI0025936355|nr:hypothetical protein [uncultured Sneathia sp.]